MGKKLGYKALKTINTKLLPALALFNTAKNLDQERLKETMDKIKEALPKPLPHKPQSNYTGYDRPSTANYKRATSSDTMDYGFDARLAEGDYNQYIRERNTLYGPGDPPKFKDDPEAYFQWQTIDSKDLTKHLKPEILNVAPDTKKVEAMEKQLQSSEINSDNVNYSSNDNIDYSTENARKLVEDELLKTDLNSIDDFEKDHYNKLRSGDTYIPR